MLLIGGPHDGKSILWPLGDAPAVKLWHSHFDRLAVSPFRGEPVRDEVHTYRRVKFCTGLNKYWWAWVGIHESIRDDELDGMAEEIVGRCGGPTLERVG